MTHPEGGLYAAEDADSTDPGSGEKKEGWFYVWSADEVNELLGEGHALQRPPQSLRRAGPMGSRPHAPATA